jgi:hypothetical protein
VTADALPTTAEDFRIWLLELEAALLKMGKRVGAAQAATRFTVSMTAST